MFDKSVFFPAYFSQVSPSSSSFDHLSLASTITANHHAQSQLNSCASPCLRLILNSHGTEVHCTRLTGNWSQHTGGGGGEG